MHDILFSLNYTKIFIIPAQAGTSLSAATGFATGIPACAGMIKTAIFLFCRVARVLYYDSLLLFQPLICDGQARFVFLE
jgi:hypothetical protein